MKKYTTDKKVEKIKTQKILSIVLILIGLFILLIDGIPNFTSFQDLGDSLISILFMLFGISMFFRSSNLIKKIKDEFFIIEKDKLIVHQNQRELLFNSENKSKVINVKLKSIEIETIDNAFITINLDNDILTVSEKQELKKSIENLKKNLIA